MTALDDLARHLLYHVAAPLVHAVRIQRASDAIAPWRALTAAEQEAVVLILAALADPHDDPDEALSWLTDPVLPEHSDLWTESPLPLLAEWSTAVSQ